MMAIMFVIGFAAGVGTTFAMYMMIWQQFQDEKRRIMRRRKKDGK